MTRYLLAIESGDEHTAFGAMIPDIPGAVSAGDTLEEARHNVAEAARIVLEDRRERGLPAPEPGRIEDYRDRPGFAGWEWEMIDVEAAP